MNKEAFNNNKTTTIHQRLSDSFVQRATYSVQLVYCLLVGRMKSKQNFQLIIAIIAIIDSLKLRSESEFIYVDNFSYC